MASAEQLSEPIIAERKVGDLHIILRDSIDYVDAEGIFFQFIGPDKTVELDLTAVEADWLKTLLTEVI